MMKRNLCSLAAFVFVRFLFWVGGLDFERGEKQAWAMMAFVAFVAFFVVGVIAGEKK